MKKKREKKEIQWLTIKEFKEKIFIWGSRMHAADPTNHPADYWARAILFQEARRIFKLLTDEEKKRYNLKASSFLQEDERDYGGINGYEHSKVVPWTSHQVHEMVKILLDYTFASRVGRLSYGDTCQVVGTFFGWSMGFRGTKTTLKSKIDYLLKEGNEDFRNILVGAVELAFVESQANPRPAKAGTSIDDPKAVWEELKKPAVINADVINLDEVRRQKEGGAQ
ncbi:MAG: hypothetical protein IIA63_02965 [Nitrospinae bacterium]|nr:hypothetical protein [Nitrospinota bacterium]